MTRIMPRRYFVLVTDWVFKLFAPRRIGQSSSSSAHKWLDFITYNSTEECLNHLKKNDYRIIATVLSEKAENLFNYKFPEKVALVLGNEHRGLSAKAIEMADKHLILPMSGMVQSLNLSVTGAIFLYEIVRQRKNRNFKSFMPPGERKLLIENFLQR
ncbi:MAG: tRNA methyltransferase [Candidatus Gottesmanbacteria bacterium GW2011_GWC2_39_8]|uniref:tRNA methyltransferase n=1 Tax=Candidatus Gottesmanbacteria bacterium GW2011_GWC2_39_8 TaxID=1618450 RepID=A0A0G0PSH4_9BACT|nr:MAG: tRNA methyltransferase [Candidatus Gottesmanbacteria bacterium GW2011_GWC2_39_8]